MSAPSSTNLLQKKRLVGIKEPPYAAENGEANATEDAGVDAAEDAGVMQLWMQELMQLRIQELIQLRMQESFPSPSLSPYCSSM